MPRRCRAVKTRSGKKTCRRSSKYGRKCSSYKRKGKRSISCRVKPAMKKAMKLKKPHIDGRGKKHVLYRGPNGGKFYRTKSGKQYLPK